MRELSAQQMALYLSIAKMYYIDNLSQNQIADKLMMSRSNVSRILSDCVKRHIVEISVADTYSCDPKLARELKKRFDLREVIIATTGMNAEQTVRHVGSYLANYLTSIAQDDMLIGVTRGKALYQATRSLSQNVKFRANVIQLMGATSCELSMDEGPMLVNLLARRTQGIGYSMCAPLTLKERKAKELLLQTDLMAEYFERFRSLDICLIGIEQLELLLSNQLCDRFFSKSDAIQLSELKAVGSACGLYYDINGLACNAGINDRVCCVDHDILRTVPHSIGIAYGNSVFPAVLGVLRSRIINTLVIDEVLAKSLSSV